MGSITVRNLPDEVHQALRLRAASHSRSTEAEVREILAAAVKPKAKTPLGSAMASYSKQNGLTNNEAVNLDSLLAGNPAKPMEFE